MYTRNWFLTAIFILAGWGLCAIPAFSKPSPNEGKLKIHVEPKQAYVFVDGKAMRDGSETIKLDAGDHKVGVYNYGYTPRIQTVHIEAGKETPLNVALEKSGDKVAGPFAEIELKGAPRAAVLLNGTTPPYFVGHVDEFDWDWIWHQRLLVQPGTYQLTATFKGNTLWSGTVTAKAGQHLTVHFTENGRIKTQPWREGMTMGPQPRFKVGIASATIPIAPVSAQLAAQNTNLTCGQSTALNWQTANALDTSISGVGEVDAKGERTVTPTHNTDYVLKAKGPGGMVTRTVTIDDNTQPTATLALSEPEVHYHKVGDKVVEQDSAAVNWSTSNASSATIEPFDSTALDGSRTVTPAINQTQRGPVSQDITYTLTATNACGGTLTKTATLHVSGSIDPPPPITLASLFYPTNFPTKKHPDVGLVRSEKVVLKQLAQHFDSYQQYDQKARLMIVAHADVRAPRAYNQALSERRADLIRDYLVSLGVPRDRIQMRAVGKDEQLDEQRVKALQTQDPEKPERWETRNMRATWLAYNRRADVILEPEGQTSSPEYPNDVADARILWQLHEPKLKAVTTAAIASPSGVEQASAGNATH